MATEKQIEEVTALIENWRASMAAVDIDTLKSHWDQAEPNVIYIAEENERALIGWTDIEKYYAGLADLTNGDYVYSDLLIDVFGDTAYAFCYVIGRADTPPDGQRFEFNMRNTFVLRRREGKWKIIHYHESSNPAVGPDGRPV